MTPHSPTRKSPALVCKKLAGFLFLLFLLSLLPAFAAAQSPPPPLRISEFRLRGWDGAADEYVEIYNNSDAAHTVSSGDGSAGYALVASDGLARFVIPNGTVVPARGHFLGVNANGYSLDAYPAASGTTATGDAAFFLDIPDNAGLALFRTSNPAAFTLANRLDAVGTTAVANALFREGAGLPVIVPFSVNNAWYRDLCGMSAVGLCATGGLPKDTGDNAADFRFGDTNGTSVGGGQQHLAAPGPENLSSPGRLNSTAGLLRALLDPNVSPSSAPNRERSLVSVQPDTTAFGALTFRRTFTNNTHATIKRLRFRVVDLTTWPADAGVADLRALSSRNASVATSQRAVNVCGTTLEEPPEQTYGGGLHSSFGAGCVTPAAPLAPGASVNVQLRFGVQQTGAYRLAVVVETLPFTGSAVWIVRGHTDSATDTEDPTFINWP